MLSRLVNLLRAGPVDVQYQGASFRFYHQASATERGALFNPDYNIEELDFLRAHAPVIGGVFVDIGANVGTYAMPLARHVGASGKVIAVEPHPVTHARLAFNRDASRFTQVVLVAAAAGPSDGELMIETDGDNLGASHIVTGDRAGNAIKVPSLRLQRILDEAGVGHVDALKIDVEGFEDRVLTGFFREAPPSLWPRAVVIEHLSRDEWQSRLHRRHAFARLRRDRQDPQQHAAGEKIISPAPRLPIPANREHHRIRAVVAACRSSPRNSAGDAGPSNRAATGSTSRQSAPGGAAAGARARRITTA